MSNLENQHWLKSLRTIDSYVQVTPNIDNGNAKVEEVVLKRGGFNNANKNYREATNNTGIMVKVDTDNSGNVLAYYSNDSGNTWNKCNGLPATWNLDSGVSSYFNLAVVCKYLYHAEQFAIIFSNDGSSKFDETGHSEIYFSANGKDWTLFQSYSNMIYDLDYSINNVMLVMGSNYVYAYSEEFGEVSTYISNSGYRRLKWVNSAGGIESFISIPNSTSSPIIKFNVSSSNGTVYTTEDRMPSTINGSYYGDIALSRYSDQHEDRKNDVAGYAIIPVYNYYSIGTISTVAFLITDLVNDERSDWTCTQSYSITLDDSNEVYWSADTQYGILKQNIVFSDYDPDGTNIAVFTMPSMKYAMYSTDFGATWQVSESSNNVLFAPNGVVYQGDKFYTSNGYASYNGLTWTKVFTGKYNRFYPTSTFTNGVNNSIPNILTYDPQKKIGYFDGETASISLNNYSLLSNNIEYASSVASDENSRLFVEFDIYTNGGKFRYLEIVGDIGRNEFPVDFEIDLGDNANPISDELNQDGFYVEKSTGNVANGKYITSNKYYITGNNLVHCIIDFGEIKNTNNPIKLTITKWSTPLTCAKINYIGTKVEYAFTKNNLLKAFNLHNKIKDERSLGYGLKYNEATLNIYNGEYSVGKYAVYEEEFDHGLQVGFHKTITLKPLNIIQVLVDAPVDTYFKFFVKVNGESGYNMIGRYYSNSVDYNTQSDMITVSMSDILQRLQSYEYSGPNLRYKYVYTYTGDTLYNILANIDKDLQEQFGININYDVEDLKSYNINKIKFDVDTVWELLEQCCNVGMFYIVPEHTNENYNMKILYRR